MPSLLRNQILTALPSPGGSGGRPAVGVIVCLVIAASGCNTTGQFGAPRKLGNVASASPLPPAYSQPPIEPPPPAPPASVSLETSQPPVAAPAAADDAQVNALREEVERLRSDVAALKNHQDQTQSALESMTASSLATANRAAAIEAHLALQASLIDDLRTATQQQQREQWKALDAVSEGIDRMLKKSGQEPTSRPIPAAPSGKSPYAPGDLPLEEILSREPGDGSGRSMR